jgi:hypothetical protein
MDPEGQGPDATDKLWMDGDVRAQADPAPDDAASPEGAPTKVCPACSVAERTSGAFCPHCARHTTAVCAGHAVGRPDEPC